MKLEDWCLSNRNGEPNKLPDITHAVYVGQYCYVMTAGQFEHEEGEQKCQAIAPVGAKGSLAVIPNMEMLFRLQELRNATSTTEKWASNFSISRSNMQINIGHCFGSITKNVFFA